MADTNNPKSADFSSLDDLRLEKPYRDALARVHQDRAQLNTLTDILKREGTFIPPFALKQISSGKTMPVGKNGEIIKKALDEMGVALEGN